MGRVEVGAVAAEAEGADGQGTPLNNELRQILRSGPPPILEAHRIGGVLARVGSRRVLLERNATACAGNPALDSVGFFVSDDPGVKMQLHLRRGGDEVVLADSGRAQHSFGDHNPPHFHARYAGRSAKIAIDGDVLDGRPERATRFDSAVETR